MEIGQKIKRLRVLKGLTQEELADRAELSKGFISQVERDLTSPSIATLVDILQCLGTTISEFFNDNLEEQIVFGKEDFFQKVDAAQGSTVEWIVPNAQKNRMEPILLKLEPGGGVQEEDPHEGEEFGYVLLGAFALIMLIPVSFFAVDRLDIAAAQADGLRAWLAGLSDASALLLLLGCVLAALAVYAICYLISVRVYRKKEL